MKKNSKPFKTIFISYSWEDQELAEKIYNDLSVAGIYVIKDNHELEFTDKISQFMKRIREADFVLLLISEGYINSRNCMYEALQLLKEIDPWKKILPIVKKDLLIYDPIDRASYINYWEKKYNELRAAASNLDPVNAKELYQDLSIYQDIAKNVDVFLKKISDTLHSTPEKLLEENYAPIITRINQAEIKSLQRLLAISVMKDLKKRIKALNNYKKVFSADSSYYTLLGGTYREIRKFDLAKENLERAIDLNKSNFMAYNDLGQILELIYDDTEGAKICYEKSIKSNTTHAVPRLNLGVLIHRKFDDIEGAKFQYEKILEFDPANPKAHNNLGNIYRTDKYYNKKNIKYHFTEAIKNDPNYIEPYIGYGNYLKVTEGKMEDGNKMYRLAKEKDLTGDFQEMLDFLIKSEKG